MKTLNVNTLEHLDANKNNPFPLDNNKVNSLKKPGRTTADYSNDFYPEKAKNRNSFHQNVEEALSSLLWQPYEYQNQNNNSEYHQYQNNGNFRTNCDYESSHYSTCSYTPSSSPISLFDLDEPSDNAASIITSSSSSSSCSSSKTKKNDEDTPSSSLSSNFLQCTTTTATSAPPPSSAEQRRDLHSDVINLNRLVVPFDQWECSILARDHFASGGAVVLDWPFASSFLESGRVVDCALQSCFGVYSGESSMQSASPSTGVPVETASGLINVAPNENGLKIEPDLNAVNIVGLPSSSNSSSIHRYHHARYSSAPYSVHTSRPQSDFPPQHFRNVSEPSRYHLQATVPTTANFSEHLHFRSSSVPKSMTLVSKYDNVTTTNGTSDSVRVKGSQVLQQNINYNNANNSIRVATTRPLLHVISPTNSIATPTVVPVVSGTTTSSTTPPGNVTNVNVNFYRAVPANVVSTVPTIHCLNTLSTTQGNSVSNVQVLPLGTQLPIAMQNSQQDAVVTVNNVNPEVNEQIITSRIGYPEGNLRGFIKPNCGTALQVQGSCKVNVQNSGLFSTDVSCASHGGRVITTTAQINSRQVPSGTSVVRTRTFTSTEAQTDEILPVNNPPSTTVTTGTTTTTTTQKRRRERRERRQNRRPSRTTNDTSTQAGTGTLPPPNHESQDNRLPDILNSHLPPAYSTLPNQNASILPPPQILPPPTIIPGAMLPNAPGPVLQTIVPPPASAAFVFPAPHQQMAPLMQAGAVPVPTSSAVAAAATGFRFGFPANGFRRSRFSPDDSPKSCCGFLSWKPGSLRWFIALIALVAVCCVLVGTALGAMRPAGRDHLTVSLLMIGVGIVLITVSGVAWRLTSHDSSTCRSMLGLGSTESVDVCARRFVPRLPPSYGRPHHPYAAMMYPEFQYRPPPPSYQASMQEYRLRLLLLDRGNTPQIQAGVQNAVSPPPTYRSHAGSLLRAPLSSRREVNQSEYSCPPSYRSQNSSNRPGTLTNGSILHSRDPSLTMSDSNQESVVNVVNILGGPEEDIALDNITLDSLKMDPEVPDPINPLRMLLKGSQNELDGTKDGNLVTIVQTSDQNPVIVTVSGSSTQDNNSTVQIREIPSEMEILAHL
ncbi:hypothetical protein ABEB36_010068 [Hypothenemus hampei]|uniref:Uncharacterized protein n=1 Tax=Hypothenemus hampei TaxID=57062 RepID=A0ABD1EID8_HYPHA